MDQSRPPLTKAKSLLDPQCPSKTAEPNRLNQEFVDSVMKSQSERLDEQRCSAFLLNQDLIQLIDKVQSKGRMDDQRFTNECKTGYQK
ncbi:hypothetical protein TrispH2_003079 [Trichoplax sp. H2]|nr:hypothetical protein TrispH2_003079 [Trichoplax sp. H2]|eukprot:RDD44383.1 hypothetical protein TrispH2_003079 [Trichoplax sp. H2]